MLYTEIIYFFLNILEWQNVRLIIVVSLILLPYLRTQPNTFQAIIAANDSSTIAVFSYECGKLIWMSDKTVIGYSTGLDEFEMVALDEISKISCSNIPVVWANLIYTIGSVGNDLTHSQIPYSCLVH